MGETDTILHYMLIFSIVSFLVLHLKHNTIQVYHFLEMFASLVFSHY